MVTNLLRNNRQKQPSIGFTAATGSSNADQQLSRGDLINEYLQEHCCSFMPVGTEARKLVSAMKENALYTRNVDTIATSLFKCLPNCLKSSIRNGWFECTLLELRWRSESHAVLCT